MTHPALSSVIQDLLKAVYVQQQAGIAVELDALATVLGITPLKLSRAIEQAAKKGLVTLDEQTVHLTENGQTTAQSLTRHPSEAVENFLKAVYTLQETHDRVSTNALKDALSISAPSVTDMAQRLVEAGLVDYRKYYGVRLTALGEQIALNTIRRHRLIELYLVEELGYALHEVHDEAEALEHVVSERFIQAIDLKLGQPRYDPHGDPIPAPDGTIHNRELQPLADLALATPARVSRYAAEAPELLQHIITRGFTLDTEVEVRARDPFDGPLTIRIDGEEAVIGHALATVILVEIINGIERG